MISATGGKRYNKGIIHGNSLRLCSAVKAKRSVPGNLAGSPQQDFLTANTRIARAQQHEVNNVSLADIS